MAGFFGLFDYNKVGPGVDKNAPKKKGFIVFFEIYFRKFWKLICANLLYVLISLPVLTIGLSQTGLTYITRNFAREKHAFIAGDFFDTIKKNWKQALVYGILNVLITGLLVFDIVFFLSGMGIINLTGEPLPESKEPGLMMYIMTGIIFMMYIIFTFMKYYIPMMIITFKLTLKQVFKNSLIFAFAGMPRNLLISVILLVCYGLMGILLLFVPFHIALTIILFLYILLFPAFRSLVIQYNIFPLIKKHMIDPYYKEHPGEDKEAKRALNLDDLDEPDEDEAPVFQDMGRTDKHAEEEEPEKKPARTLPKQYSEQEMRKGRRLYKQNAPRDDDDDTI